VTFNLTVQIPISGLSLVSGGGQSVVVGQAFANPVVFVIRDANNNPVPNLLVNFSVAGNGTINPSSATTSAQGQVQTSETAGATPDTIQVTARYLSFFSTAVLSSHVAGPQITTTSFVNAASLAVGMTPCGLVTVSGPGIAPTLQVGQVISGVSAFGPLPYTLALVSISIQQGSNNFPAPIQAVANVNGVQQANFQAPCELTAGTATVVVTVNGANTPVAGVAVLVVQPGIFTYAGPNGKAYGAVIREADGSYITPSNLARQGDKLLMVVTGLGQATPTLITNSAGTGSQNVNLQIVVGVHDNGVPVLSARYLVGFIGAYLVEFQLPPDAPLGTDQSLAVAARLSDGSLRFGNPVFMPGVIAGP
jgi:adhesin/invasin